MVLCPLQEVLGVVLLWFTVSNLWWQDADRQGQIQTPTLQRRVNTPAAVKPLVSSPFLALHKVYVVALGSSMSRGGSAGGRAGARWCRSNLCLAC